MKKPKNREIIIYQAKSGAIELRGDWKKETIWASLQQIADLFSTDKSGISRHIKNLFKTGELNKSATVAKIATVQSEGKRKVLREIECFNLDVILSVGYRVNSKKATQFRIWATSTLREYLIKGYAINRSRIAQNYELFMKSVADVQALLPEHVVLDPKKILDLIKEFAGTWMSLNAYDKESLKTLLC